MNYSSVVGQEKIKKHLQDITRNGSISHGYIFEGPKGIGKLQLAKVFAQTILCKVNNVEPCGKCSSCIKANANNHPDIHIPVSYTHLRAHETRHDIVCRLLL